MKEKLIDIVQNIDSCDTARRGSDIYPIARIHCIYDGKPQTFWLTKRYGDYRSISQYGRFVPDYSDVAIRLQTTEVGGYFQYEQQNHIKRVEQHFVVLENRSNFQNQTIAIAGDDLLYQYRNIREFLTALCQNREDIAEVEAKIAELKEERDVLAKQKNTATQRSQITKTISKYLEEYRILTQQQEDLKNITIYIRKQGEMRYSLIVDTVQTRIKSQNLFDGKTVIINGGPGTGKSTTMIHRLAYLTNPFAIKEDEEKMLGNYKLNASQRKQLLEAIKVHRDWMFFSPSQMLKEYLADAMKKEGLTNTYQKVWNWKDYCRMVLEANYKLLGDDNSKAPFRICYLTDTLFYQNSDITTVFMEFYLNQLRSIKSTLPKLNKEGQNFAWTSIARNIAQRFEDSESYDLAKFVSLFNSLESVYSLDCRNLRLERNEVVVKVADRIFDLLDSDKNLNRSIRDLLDLDIEEGNDDSVEEYEENDDDVKQSSGLQRLLSPLEKVPIIKNVIRSRNDDKQDANSAKLQKSIEAWIRAYSHSKVNSEVHLSDIQMLITEVLLPALGDKYNAQIQKIGELMEFEQYAQYTKGVKSIMLTGLPALYKKFRNHLAKTKFEGCNLKLLRDVTQLKNGKALHHQEQSLLLGFVNTIVKQLKSIPNSKIKHEFIDAYDELSRPIIGIDEATDFSACDIYAMQSLLTRDFNSLTLCGDMMQRLTTYGIQSWSELNGVVANPMVVEMKTSYRQSKKLLDVAKQMYIDTLGETPKYKAFMKSNKVPAPLIYIDESEHAKIQWISKRISEVFRAYGEQLPSIAIFVNDKGYIPGFVERLQETEFFTKNKVRVLDGVNAKDKPTENHICVYPIDVVKGMEFDVVFFHNIDNSSADTEIMKRYIYVGVSRAAFFLGITLSEPNQEISKYFERNKDWFKI